MAVPLCTRVDEAGRRTPRRVIRRSVRWSGRLVPELARPDGQLSQTLVPRRGAAKASWRNDVRLRPRRAWTVLMHRAAGMAAWAASCRAVETSARTRFAAGPRRL